MTGLSRSTIYELQADRRFPQSIKIAARAVGWMESEVQEWIEWRAEVRLLLRVRSEGSSRQR